MTKKYLTRKLLCAILNTARMKYAHAEVSELADEQD